MGRRFGRRPAGKERNPYVVSSGENRRGPGDGKPGIVIQRWVRGDDSEDNGAAMAVWRKKAGAKVD
jgi:hypothetical protein